MSKLTLLILAAGIGSRYGGLKQMDPIGPAGETIIDYSVFDAMRAKFNKLVFVIRRDIEMAFKETIGRRFENRIAVEYVFQEMDSLPANFAGSPNRKRPWGTGHAVLVAENAIEGPFGVINADDFYGADSFRGLAEHLNSNNNYAMMGFDLRNTLSTFGSVARGVCQLTPDGFLKNVTEIEKIEKDGRAVKYLDPKGATQSLTGDEIVSMNMWGVQPDIFPQLRRQMIAFLQQHGHEEKAEFFIPNVVNTLINTGHKRVKVLHTNDSWFGVTYREDRTHVVNSIHCLIERSDYPERLWS
jgi:dTDP-glucose pyrophosphorylase